MQIHRKILKLRIVPRVTRSIIVGFAAALIITPLAADRVVASVPAAGVWTATGSLLVARTGYTSTLLQNGKVLVAGGSNPTTGTDLANAEVYDPSTGIWSPTGSLNIARSGHTATLLSDGRVLVAGGSVAPYAPTASAELYDPATGIWTVTGSMADGRIVAAAVRLADGKVLDISGWTGSPALLSSSELYDPSTGTWSYTGNVVTPRLYHMAVVLHDGRVLVAGGNTYGTPTASSEIYDPSSGTWSPTASMSVPRGSGVTVTVLSDGRVLAAGGPSGYSYGSAQPVASSEIFDPSAGTWSPAASMSIPRVSQSATLLPSGKVLVAGGNDYSGTIYSSAELYDSSNDTWTATASMSGPRAGQTAELLSSGKVIVVGGNNATGYLSSAELYSSTYGWSGFLQPINSDGSSIFKLGRTVPVKFQLAGASAGITNLQAKLYVSKISNNVEGSDLEAISTSAADSGNTFRYDPASNQYIFNLGTQNLSAGTYRLKIYVDGDTSTGVLQGAMLISLK